MIYAKTGEDVVRCPYCHFGCKKLVKIAELPTHINTDRDSHLELAMSTVMGLTAVVPELAARCNMYPFS